MATTVSAQRLGKRAFWILVIGVALNALAVVAWTLLGPAETGSGTQLGVIFAAVAFQAGAVACLLTAMILGIVALAQGARPLVWALLAALSIPIAAIMLPLELLLVRAVYAAF